MTENKPLRPVVLGEEKENNKLSIDDRPLHKTYQWKACLKESKRIAELLDCPAPTPREYMFLKELRKRVVRGKDLDMEKIARKVGYTKYAADKVEERVLKKIDPRFFAHVVGVGEADLELQMAKMIFQDEDKNAKAQFCRLYAAIKGKMTPSAVAGVQIVLPKIDIKD